METKQMISMVTTMTGETDENTIRAYLDLAGAKVLNKCYPFYDGAEPLQVPTKYHHVQVELAAYMIRRSDSDDEKSHSENGVSVTYSDKNEYTEALLSDVIPFGKVLS